MSLETVLIVVFSYLIAAALLVSLVMHKMSVVIEIIKNIDEEKEEPNGLKGSKGWLLNQWQVLMLGFVERLLYLISIMVSQPEFIVVWLTLKTVYESWSKKGVSGRRIYNNFLLGNGLSILYAFAVAGFIQWETGSILPHGHSKIFMKNPCLAIISLVAPVVLSLLFIGILWIVGKRLKKLDVHTHTQ